ncbi:MAG: hypothetical protein B7X02_00090 [Rhodospirillales bacterium 12-54-5]|nr:MAG: hypothetical protein B7X02_00090 [Rhodospirillales bacterium 12-54-5]
MNAAANYHIHPAGLRHVEALSRLHTACFAKGWGPLEFESFFERSGVFMAMAYHENATPVGFVLCWVIEDQCDLASYATGLCTARSKAYGREKPVTGSKRE